MATEEGTFVVDSTLPLAERLRQVCEGARGGGFDEIGVPVEQLEAILAELAAANDQLATVLGRACAPCRISFSLALVYPETTAPAKGGA